MGAARTATVGEQLIVSCMTFGATKAPNLTLHVNNQKLIRGGPIRGGRVDVEPVRVAGSGRNEQGTALVGYIDTVYDNMFRYGSNKMTVECKAWYGDQIFEKESMELTKETGRNHQWIYLDIGLEKLIKPIAKLSASLPCRAPCGTRIRTCSTGGVFLLFAAGGRRGRRGPGRRPSRSRRTSPRSATAGTISCHAAPKPLAAKCDK